MIEDILKEAEESMKKSINHFKSELAGFRTGRASSSLVEDIKIEYYGSRVPIKQVGNVSVPESNQILIQVWDQNAISPIEKAIMEQLSLNPARQGNTLRITLPPLTQERRKELVKLLHKTTEEAKVAIRNIRRDAKEMIESLEGISEDEIKRALDKLQKITDKYIDEISNLSSSKEKEITELK
ncbi:MAG: ribosome recycling factor [Hydrogenobaculum sp.]